MKLSKRHRLLYILNISMATIAYFTTAALLMTFLIDENRHVGQLTSALLAVLLGATNTVAALRHHRLRDSFNKDGF